MAKYPKPVQVDAFESGGKLHLNIELLPDMPRIMVPAQYHIKVKGWTPVKGILITKAEYLELKRLASRSSHGGKKGGAARARSLSPEKRQEIARKAAQARWGATRSPLP